jgi:glycine oxidase
VTSSTFDVAVAGGGAIGLACAWRAAGRGLRTVVLDAGRGEARGEAGDERASARQSRDGAAWQVAAGMLAPVAEAEPGEAAVLELGLRSARGFAAFCAELAEVTGIDPGHRRTGTLAVARDRDEAEALERSFAFRRELGLEVERLRPSQARRVEPALAPTVRLALAVPGDHSVDPRRMIAALAAAFERTGGTFRCGARVTGVAVDGVRATGLRLAGGEVVQAGHVVVAAGTGIAGLDVPEDARVPIRPVKGQVLRLRDPRGPGLVERTIRGLDVYLVPRADGHYILGATMEERGWDTAPTAGGVYELLRDMSELVPGVLEFEIEELRAGLRPATPDNLPAIGHGALEGLVWAAGHYRNGILLAPVTADLVAGALCDEAPPDWAASADPRRFAREKVPA